METALEQADGRAVLLQRVRQDMRRVDARARELRQVDARLTAASLLTSALATLVAGLTAAAGPLIGTGPPAWRWACAGVAVITAVSGALTGAHQRFRVPERRAQAIACAGRLRSLELALGLAPCDAQQVAREYREVVAHYQELGL